MRKKQLTAPITILILCLTAAMSFCAVGYASEEVLPVRVETGANEGLNISVTESLVTNEPDIGTPGNNETAENKDSGIDEAAENDKGKTGSDKVTIMLTGDLMCKGLQQKAAMKGSSYDFEYVFKYVLPIFDEADILIGNLETVISEKYPYSKDKARDMDKPYLNSPKEWVECLAKVGYDGVITANNHACDCGEQGIKDTIKALDKAKIKHTGTFAKEKDKRYMILEANGIKVGILGYSAIYNGKETLLSKKKQEYMLNFPSTARVKRDVKALKKAGAEYIIAYNHAGTEYTTVHSRKQIDTIQMLLNGGVDYIINSHSHCLQEYAAKKSNSKTGKTPVWYSLGNFTSSINKMDGATMETVIVKIQLKRDKTGKVKLSGEGYYPVYQAKKYKGKKYVLLPESAQIDSDDLEKRYKNIRKTIGSSKRLKVYS